MSRSTYLEKEVIQEHISSAGSYDGTESGLSSNNVLDAIDEVKSLITLPSASQVSFTAVDGNLTETDNNVQSAVGTLDGAVRTLQTQVIGGVTYKGGYNANTNIPDLESPDTITIEVGDMYTVTGNGDFYTEAVTIGDVLIAEVDSPTSIDGWTVVENNLEDAADVAFDNTNTGLAATNVQTAVDELQTAKLDNKYLKISSAFPGASASGNGAISIGPESNVNANGGIAIGSKASSTFQLGVAIGASALASSADAVALGSSSSASGSDSIALGHNAEATFSNSTSLGSGASATRSGAVAIGISSNANATASLALGSNATASVSECIQLGNGTNSSFATLQFKNNRLANAEGLYTSHAATNYSPSDSDNVTSHFEAIDVALGSVSSAQAATVNEETITTNKTLVPEDSIYQHILSDTTSLEVALPSSPVNGTHFIIKNDDAGSEDITITGGPVAAVLSPGRMYEVVYGSTKWMVI